MQENKNDISERSQASEPGHRDTSPAFLHSSKLRYKLEKLAEWRIDPSLIKFPADSREFRGGFATVSQGLLVSPPGAGGVTNEFENSTGEHPSSGAGNLQSEGNMQNHGDNQRDKDGGADERKAGGNDDTSKAEGSKDNNVGQELDNQLSTLRIGHQITSHEDTINDVPSSGDRDIHSNRDIETTGDDQQGSDEGTDNRIVNGDSPEKQAGNDLESTNEEQNGDGQTSKPKLVAVKMLEVKDEADLERVLGLALREAEFLAELSHWNVVELEGFVEDLSEQKVWLIFPWEEHGNLRDFLTSGEWEIPERISLINDVTQGLEYLHEQDPPIFHGDLKSLNILVNSECHALITDFGSARHLKNDHVGKHPEDKPRPATRDSSIDEHITLEAIFSATASTLTLTGSSYTLRWAAPELLQDDKPCLGSDIWALGWIAYEVMTNTIPFHNIKKDSIVISHVIQGQLPSITDDARMSLIRGLCSLMVRCWSINPDKRPTAEECRKLISWMPMIVPPPSQAMTEEASQIRHAQLLNKLGYMYRRQADDAGAFNSFTAALDIYTNHHDHKGRGRTLRNLADAHRFRHEHNEALKLYSEALQIFTERDDEGDRGDVLFGLASTHLDRHDHGEAAKLFSECLQIVTNTGDQRQRACALWGLAEVRREQAEYREAIDLYSEALQIYTEVGDERERALTLCGLALLHYDQEEDNEAIKLWSEALQIYSDVGDHRERVTTLNSLATVYCAQSRDSEASRLYSESLQISIDIGDRQGRGSALCGLAEMHRDAREYDEATQLFSEALEIFTDIGDKHEIADTLISYAETNELWGHLREAASLFGEASEVLDEIGDSSRASDASRRATDIRKKIRRSRGRRYRDKQSRR